MSEPLLTDEEILSALDLLAMMPVCDYTPFELSLIAGLLNERATAVGEGRAPALEAWKHPVLAGITAARGEIAHKRETEATTVWGHRRGDATPRPAVPELKRS